jgi:hypothetical protein
VALGDLERLFDGVRTCALGGGTDRGAQVILTLPRLPPKEAIEARRRRANDADHYHSVANLAKGEKPGERGLPKKGYRPGRKTARRPDKKRKRKSGDSGPRP